MRYPVNYMELMPSLYEQAAGIRLGHEHVPDSFADYELAYQLYPKIFEEEYDPGGPTNLKDRIHLRGMLKAFEPDLAIMRRVDTAYGDPDGRTRAAARIGGTAFIDMCDDAAKYRLLNGRDEVFPLSAQLKLGVVAYKHLQKSGKHTEITYPATRHVLHGVAREGVFAYQALFHTNQRMVIANARKYYQEGISNSLDLTDLVAAGGYGLHRAIELFDASKNRDFYVYAKTWVMREVRTIVADHGKPIRYPTNIENDLATIRRAERACVKKFRRYPSDYEVAGVTGMGDKDIKHLREWQKREFVSTEQLLHTDSHAGQTVMESLAATPDTEDTSDEDTKTGQEKLRKLIEEAATHPTTALTPAEILAVSMRYQIIIESMDNELIAIRGWPNNRLIAEVPYEETVLKTDDLDKNGLATTQNIGEVAGITKALAERILSRAMSKLEGTRERMEQLEIPL